MIDRAFLNQPHKPFDFFNDYKDTRFWLEAQKNNKFLSKDIIVSLAIDILEERLDAYNKSHPNTTVAKHKFDD